MLSGIFNVLAVESRLDATVFPIRAEALNGTFLEKIVIALVSATLAFISSYILAQIKQRREPRKQLAYDIEVREGIIAVEEQIKPNLIMLYNGKEIRDLYQMSINIENTGNTVVKNQYVRFEFSPDVEIIETRFEPKPELEMGLEETDTSNISLQFERRFLMKHVERGKTIGFRFILTCNHMPSVKLHPYNETGDVEFVPRITTRVSDARYHLQTFTILLFWFLLIPPIFYAFPDLLGTTAAGLIKLVLFLLILPHLRPSAKVISEFLLRFTTHASDEQPLRLNLVRNRRKERLRSIMDTQPILKAGKNG